ncbi:uncharacterized protein LOC120090877 [Benincasa hispida]|uniref:uncharacterized protein LOC120090877 n=1 Tax=Benincasa hispida TaxID=102211 RepID=UPI0019005AAA|nr:uncharacterized protein LOC120090877 [Benincasa hispida]
MVGRRRGSSFGGSIYRFGSLFGPACSCRHHRHGGVHHPWIPLGVEFSLLLGSIDSSGSARRPLSSLFRSWRWVVDVGSIDLVVGFSNPIVYLPDLLVGLSIQSSILYFCQICHLNFVRKVRHSNLRAPSSNLFKFVGYLSCLLGKVKLINKESELEH